MDESDEYSPSDLKNKEDKAKLSKLDQKTMSRRQFLKTASLVTASVAATALNIRGDTLQTPEVEKEPTLIELDIFDTEKLRQKLIRENFPADFSEKEVLETMGVSDPTTEDGLNEGTPVNDEQAKLLLLRFLELKYKNHGQDVSKVGQKTEELLSKHKATPVVQVSIVEAFGINRLTYDKLGNPVLSYSISQDKINELLNNTPADLVNMSWQPGVNEIKFVMYENNARYPTKVQSSYTDSEGKITPYGEPKYLDTLRNEITKEEYEKLYKEAKDQPKTLLPAKARYIDFVDGYFGEHTTGNLNALVEIANNNSGKVFFAAGGNPTELNEIPDIRKVKSILEHQGKWPENLFISGYEVNSQGFRIPASRGGDIYIEGNFIQNELGFEQSSSFATRVATETVRHNVKFSKSTFSDKVREFIHNNSDSVSSWNGNEEIKYKLLKIDSLIKLSPQTNNSPLGT